MGDRVYTDGLITDGASLDPGVVMSVFPGSVRGYLKISDDTGGLSGPGATPSNPGGLLADVDRFGASAAGLGDLDGDGFLDVVVGATGDDDGAIVDGGAIYILRLNDDGTVKARQRINDSEGGLSGPGNPGGQVGSGALLGFFSTRLGDIDGDGVVDIAVSGCGLAGGCNDPSQSALWVLRMNADGTAKASVRIRDGEGGLPPGTLADVAFDGAIAGLGDMNGDRVPDLVVGEWSENGSGAVYILYLAPDGSVASFLRISDIEGGLSGPGDPGGTLAPGDGFGFGLAGLGDLDGNGVPDMAVGAPGDDSAGVDRGAVWILWLNPDGTVATKRRIATGQSGFAGLTKAGDSFGVALSSLGDLDGDGVLDLAVGARNDRTLEANDGSVWILFLNPDASVKSHQKISPLEGRFDGGIDFSDRFGGAVTALGDIDGDGVMDLGVGAIGDSVAGNWRGAFWELFLDGAPIVCGNGVLDPVVEECDDGNAISEDGCSDACVDEYCGDGVVQVGLGETCEDGNSVDEDGCSSSCVAEYCGDGIVQAGLGETCDDGGTAWGDGCSAECWPEADSYDLYRFAFGGTLSITINGVTVVVQIPAGATASEALSLLAQAIESHPTLSAMGVRASVDGNRLYTSAPIASLTVGDPWLAQTPSTATVSAHVDRAGFDAVLPGPASIEDFESLTDGAPVSALGPLSFSEMVVGEDLRATDAFDTQSPILSLGLDNPDEALLDGDALYIDASMPLDAIGLYVVASDAVLPGEIRLVTPLGATLGDAAPVGTLADGGLVYFLGFASDQTFDQALVGFEGDGEVNFVYTADDVLYHVPEPAIGMMLAAGTALLGVLERRRRGTRGLGEREKR
jgi:cysteine-rich repeat protein